jgi:hypothetical protein
MFRIAIVFAGLVAVSLPLHSKMNSTNGVAGDSPIADTCKSAGADCTQNSDCCSKECDFSNGRKVCWP